MPKRSECVGLLLLTLLLPPAAVSAQPPFAPWDGSGFFSGIATVSVSKVTFNGAIHLTEKELRAVTKLTPGEAASLQTVQCACKEIEDIYHVMGWSFASCTSQFFGTGDDFKAVFDITEGPKVKGADINFVGASSIRDSRLAAKLHSTSEWFDPKTATALLERKSEEQPLARVGQIFINGNKEISQDSILAHVPLFPGQILNYSDLQHAEKTLAKLGVFEVDPAKDVRPTIEVINPESDSAFKDILITVKEKPQANLAGSKP